MSPTVSAREINIKELCRYIQITYGNILAKSLFYFSFLSLLKRIHHDSINLNNKNYNLKSCFVSME